MRLTWLHNIEAVENLANSGHINCSVAAKVGAVTSLPYEENSFDAVWCAAVTQYLTDAELQKMLDEFRRVVWLILSYLITLSSTLISIFEKVI